jgi:hypothetical protein
VAPVDVFSANEGQTGRWFNHNIEIHWRIVTQFVSPNGQDRLKTVGFGLSWKNLIDSGRSE